MVKGNYAVLSLAEKPSFFYSDTSFPPEEDSKPRMVGDVGIVASNLSLGMTPSFSRKSAASLFEIMRRVGVKDTSKLRQEMACFP